MYAIEEGAQRINDGTVLTFSRKVVEHNTLLKVEAGTTGYSGGDSRLAGGRTYISITCDAGDFHFGLVRDEKDRPIGIRIACCGDAGLNAIMKTLEFAHEALNDQHCDRDDCT